eukprot:scaffold10470_cov109-Ochromonas_danica.AAC.2
MWKFTQDILCGINGEWLGWRRREEALSVMWQLPEDILHSVYGEWLRWEDLARLDVACVEKRGREVWLSSLNDLRISRGDVSISDDKMRMFFMWLVNRK